MTRLGPGDSFSNASDVLFPHLVLTDGYVYFVNIYWAVHLCFVCFLSVYYI